MHILILLVKEFDRGFGKSFNKSTSSKCSCLLALLYYALFDDIGYKSLSFWVAIVVLFLTSVLIGSVAWLGVGRSLCFLLDFPNFSSYMTLVTSRGVLALQTRQV